MVIIRVAKVLIINTALLTFVRRGANCCCGRDQLRREVNFPSHFTLGKCHFISHTYLWYIFASTHPFGQPEEKFAYYQLYDARWHPNHAHVILSRGGHLCSIILL
jgi:hypothetical protein